MAAFCELLKSLRAAREVLPPADLAEKVLEASGYRDQLAAENTVEAEGRSGAALGKGRRQVWSCEAVFPGAVFAPW